jgi:hypothetical protein
MKTSHGVALRPRVKVTVTKNRKMVSEVRNEILL